jgi:hypothetical protein
MMEQGNINWESNTNNESPENKQHSSIGSLMLGYLLLPVTQPESTDVCELQNDLMKKQLNFLDLIVDKPF